MENQDESNHAHRIYATNPILLKNYVNKQVQITTKDSHIHRGIVYTVDPVSESFVLMEPNDTGDYRATIIIGDAIRLLDEMVIAREELPEFFQRQPTEHSESEIQRRKERILELLKMNRFPAIEENEVIKVHGVISIEPPYQPENCLCANPIIMSRICTILFEGESR